MRPLPRVLAFANAHVATLEDLGIRAAAIAAAGPVAGLVARWPGGSANQLTTLAARFVALATPPMACVLVTGRADIARAALANGVILRRDDLSVADVRTFCRHPERLILRSVHSTSEAEAAAADGADALIVGTIWESASHPGQAPGGTALLADIVSLGLPAYAIGGVTPERAIAAHAAGAWGVAAVGALWAAKDSYAATLEIVKPWN